MNGVEYVVICRGWAIPLPDCEHEGLYLMTYDPEYSGGKGRVQWTDDINKAHKFADITEIHKMWTAVPKSHPVRSTDGKPNRPLTAFNIEIKPCQKLN